LLEGETMSKKLISRRKFAALTASVPLAFSMPHRASANEGYPKKPIRMIAPFPPGNSSDVAARLLGEYISSKLGQPVIVDNKVGAAGQIGTTFVAKSEPDGYTLLMTSTSSTISPAIYKSLPFDILNDFAPVVRVAVAPMVLLVKADAPYAKLADFVAEIRRNPKSFAYATSGAGTIQHLTMAAFLARVNADVQGIPYKGSPQALTDLIGGQVQFMFDAVLSGRPHIDSGKLKPLAVASLKPVAQLPSAPAAAAAMPELKDFEIEGWVGLLGPKAMPASIVSRLNQVVIEAMTFPAMRDRLTKANIALAPANTPEQFGRFLRDDVKRWEDVVSIAKIPKE
jgi:tripartite-type tricarboxylate transporter receptor subunit TctC